MFTSDIDRRNWCRRALIFTLASVFCALFGAIYEIFSHGVYSYAMIYAFAYPLVGGCVPSLVMALLSRPCGCKVSFDLYVFALSCACVGSIVGGVLEIYGTSSRLLPLFYITAALAASTSVLSAILSSIKKRKTSDAV